MEVVWSDANRCELCIGDLDTFRVFVLVELGADRETGVRSRGGNELDDGAIATQWLAAPVDRDEREQPVLDLISFLAAGWRFLPMVFHQRRIA